MESGVEKGKLRLSLATTIVLSLLYNIIYAVTFNKIFL